jgi:hypothetical protein
MHGLGRGRWKHRLSCALALYSTKYPSITGYELSVVADVDADGAARPVRWPPGPA